MSSLKPVPTEERRRSTRIDRGVALIVKGADVFKVPFQEFALTQAINSYGCRYQTKHELAPGALLQLDVVHTEEGHPGRSTQARVKWVSQPAFGSQTSYFEIAVELEAPGNVWGIANPPKDWSAPERGKPSDGTTGNHGASASDRSPSSIPVTLGADAAEPLKEQLSAPIGGDSPSLAQFMAQFVDSLSAQTQTKATDAAILAVREEKDRWLENLRAELHTELPGLIERAVAAARSDWVVEAKEAREAQESTIRASYDTWAKALRAEMDEVSARFDARRSETMGQVETMASAAIERVQGSLEESLRRELEDGIGRLRSEMVPLMAEAKAATESLKGAENELRTLLLTASNAFQQFAKHEHDRVTTEVRETTERLLKEVEEYLNGRIGAARGEMEQRTSDSIERAKEALLRLSNASESDAKQKIESLLGSALGQLNSLQEKTREYAGKVESSSRRQLQFVSELLAKFAAPEQDTSENSG